jgi:hypothetical protein
MMVSWPAGHRWEDCQVTIYDKTLVHKATLGVTHKLRYNKRLFGGYGSLLTFELRRDDPWVAELTNGQLHFIRVLEDKGDGTRWQTFAGYQIKRKDADEVGQDEQFVEFTFLPLPRMAGWRVGIPVTGETLETTAKVDNAFKWFIERVLGATAPVAPTTSAVRAFTNFSVAADKNEYPTNVALKATGQNIYEFLQLHGSAYEVDWDIYLNASGYPEFETWYPRRGLDRTEGNGVNDECIFTDKQGSFRKQEYQHDTTDVVSNVLDNRFTKDVGNTDVSDAWLYREVAIPSSNEVTMAVELADRAPVLSWTMSEFVETEDRQWGLHFDVGDKVTVYSAEFGYTLNDVICDVTAEYDEAGFRRLTLTFGDPVPDQQDNQRGGGRRRLDPEYTDPRVIPDMALAILPVANTNVVGVGTRAAPDDHQHLLSLTADDTNIMTLTAGVGNVNGAGGVTTAIVGGNLVISGAGVLNAHALLSATHSDTTAASVVRGDLVTGQGAAPNTKWARLAIGAANTFAKSDGTDVGWGAAVIGLLGDAGAGSLPDANGKITVGGVNGYSFNAHDNQVDFTGPWYRDVVSTAFVRPTTSTDKVLVNTATLPDAGTYLYVDGHIRCNGTLKALDTHLFLTGKDGIVDVSLSGTDAMLNALTSAGDVGAHIDSAASSYFRGGSVHVENGHDLVMYSDAGTTSKATWDGATGTITLLAGGNLDIQTGAASKFTVLGASGNTTWAAGATLTLEGVAYLPPAAAPGGAGYALVSAAGSPYQLSWSATTTAAAHALLSATHSDTLAAAVADGSIIIGNVTPKWSALAISVPAAGLINHLAVANGETRPSWKALFDATVPTTMAPSDAAAAGTAVVAARRDHTHGAPATWTATAHNLFSAIHGDTTGAASPVDGDIIIGNVTPKWSKLAISVPAAAVRNVLGVDNGETRPSWKTVLDATNPATLTAAAAAAPGTSLVFAHRDHVHAVTSSSAPGAAAALLATNASGYLRLVRLEIYSDAKYLERSGTVLRYESDAYHTFRIGGANVFGISATAVYPAVTNTFSSGTTDLRWSTDYCIDLNASGVVYIGADCNLYRSAVNTLKTDDGLYVTGATTINSTLVVAGQLTSQVATGSAPFVVASTTKVANLNVDYLDGYSSSTTTVAETVAVRNASGNLFANAFYDGAYYCKPNGNSTFNGDLVLTGELECATLRVNQAPAVKGATAWTYNVTVNFNGSNYKVMLAA